MSIGIVGCGGCGCEYGYWHGDGLGCDGDATLVVVICYHQLPSLLLLLLSKKPMCKRYYCYCHHYRYPKQRAQVLTV